MAPVRAEQQQAQRPRGRPRKHPLPIQDGPQEAVAAADSAPKRPGLPPVFVPEVPERVPTQVLCRFLDVSTVRIHGLVEQGVLKRCGPNRYEFLPNVQAWIRHLRARARAAAMPRNAWMPRGLT